MPFVKVFGRGQATPLQDPCITTELEFPEYWFRKLDPELTSEATDEEELTEKLIPTNNETKRTNPTRIKLCFFKVIKKYREKLLEKKEGT